MEIREAAGRCTTRLAGDRTGDVLQDATSCWRCHGDGMVREDRYDMIVSGGLTQDQVALIKRTIAKGSTDDELALFPTVTAQGLTRSRARYTPSSSAGTVPSSER